MNRSSIILAAVCIALASCASPAPTNNGTVTQPSGPTQMQKLQAAAKLLLPAVKSEVANYEATHSMDQGSKSDLDQSVADLTVAVNNFSALTDGSDYIADAEALLSVLKAVSSNLPPDILSTDTQSYIALGIDAAQILLGITAAETAS